MIYYLIGINGSGMHALADILNDLKYKVLGADNNTLSDKYEIDLLDNIKYNHEYFYIIGNSFKESDIHKYLRQNKYKYDYYPSIIDKLFNNINIAVSGTHGKTTTTKFLSCLLKNSSYLIGDGSGYGNINSKYFIYEACEYKDTFLNYHPDILIITNIDYDHPDYFKDINHIIRSFRFMTMQSKVIICNGDCDNIKSINTKKITYGFKLDNDCVCSFKKSDTGYILMINYFNEIVKINYNYFGKHMIYNFLAVYTTLRYLGFSNEYIIKNIDKLKLPKRRSFTKNLNSNYYILDYAHHPFEIKSLYEGIDNNPLYKDKKKVCVFEPHTLSRLKCFKNEFKDALSLFDNVYITKLFVSNRENKDIKEEEIIYNYLKFEEYKLQNILKINNSIIVFIGAGEIDKLYYEVINKF